MLHKWYTEKRAVCSQWVLISKTVHVPTERYPLCPGRPQMQSVPVVGRGCPWANQEGRPPADPLSLVTVGLMAPRLQEPGLEASPPGPSPSSPLHPYAFSSLQPTVPISPRKVLPRSFDCLVSSIQTLLECLGTKYNWNFLFVGLI